VKVASPADVAVEIARLEQRLADLRRLERAIGGGQASGRARQKPDRDEQIRTRYLQKKGEYGVVKEIAAKTGLSVRQVRRILRRGGITRDTVADAPGSSSMGKTGREPTAASHRSPVSVDLVSHDHATLAAESPGRRTEQPGETAYIEIESLDDVLNQADSLVSAMYEEADEARIPGGLRLDLEAVLRLIEDFAGEWDGLLWKLEEVLGPNQHRPKKRDLELPLAQKRTRT
jgi:hypothetical protein